MAQRTDFGLATIRSTKILPQLDAAAQLCRPTSWIEVLVAWLWQELPIGRSDEYHIGSGR